ncbi:MAG TPA: putative PEP-binding protein, partial [Acidobacteriota bacterium]|nr:putative PEP-binding protein [Acidobacteriota bacterium]
GLRGLRISLMRPKTLVTQFRALLAASALGPVRVMVPMVTSLEEFIAARREWKRAQAELAAKDVPFDAHTPFGLMIETPAAVALAEELAAEADFLSIGSNDLIQYTMVVDRTNPRLGSLFNHWHPALWRQIATVIDAARKHDVPVAVCGEMASDPLTVPALIGLGLQAISTHPNSIPKIKSLIRSVSYDQCQGLARQILSLKTAAAIQSALKEFNRRIVIQDARPPHVKTR